MALTLQVLTGAAERLREARVELGVDWLALVEEARIRAQRDPYRPLPLQAWRQRAAGKARVITQAAPAERLLEEALRPILQRAVEADASTAAHGYRAGRSTYTAALAVSRALDAGCHHICTLDIRRFFDSIDWELLRQCLEPRFDADVTRILMGLARAPLRFGAQLERRSRGLPLGRVVSPFLANLYLAPVDAAMGATPCQYVRYADDLIVLAPAEAELDHALATLEAALGACRLKLNRAKTRRFVYAGQPFAYLGHAVDARGVYDRLAGVRLARIEAGAARPDAPTPPPDADSALLPARRSHTLYLTEPGVYLRIADGLLQISRRDEVLRAIPLHRIDRILVLSSAAMSSGFFAECIERNIPVLFFIHKGRAFGSLVASGMPNPWRLRAQYELQSNADRRLQLARNIITAKIGAMLAAARRARGDKRLCAELARCAKAVAHAASVDSVRGHEGRATRIWYRLYAAQIREPAFRFAQRSKRPPRDPVNSLLSFCYSLVFAEMQTALLARGLDPHPALVHESRPGHAALASDLVEPYRVQVADRFVRGLINQHRIHADVFRRQRNGGVYLLPEARRLVLEAFEHYMTHPSPSGTGPVPRHAMEAAATSMLRVVLGEQHDLQLPPPFRAAADD